MTTLVVTDTVKPNDVTTGKAMDSEQASHQKRKHITLDGFLVGTKEKMTKRVTQQSTTKKPRALGGAIPPLSQFVLVLYEHNKMKQWPIISIHGLCKTYPFKITNYNDNERNKLLNVALGFEKVLTKEESLWLETAREINTLELHIP
jgi:hypothetical protein